jgi:hypothetical protein
MVGQKLPKMSSRPDLPNGTDIGKNVPTVNLIISGFEEGDELYATHWKKAD